MLKAVCASVCVVIGFGTATWALWSTILRWQKFEYIVLAEESACSEYGCGAAYDDLREMPSEAIIVQKDSTPHKTLRIGSGYECMNVAGDEIDPYTRLENPACTEDDRSCEEFYGFGPSTNIFRKVMMWISVVLFTLFELGDACFGVGMGVATVLHHMREYDAASTNEKDEEENRDGERNLSPQEQFNREMGEEYGLPYPQISIPVLQFIVGGVLLTPAVMVTLFDPQEDNPCLGVKFEASMTPLIYLTNVFMFMPLSMLVALGVMAKAAEEKNQATFEFGEKALYLMAFIMLLASIVLALYATVVEAIASPLLLLGQIITTGSTLVTLLDCGCL